MNYLIKYRIDVNNTVKILNNKYSRAIIPTILSIIIGLCGNALFSLTPTSGLFIFSVVVLILCIILNIALILFYCSIDINNEKELNDLTKQLNEQKIISSQLQNEKSALEQVIIGLRKCFDENAEKLYKLVENARTNKVIDLQIWNYKIISDFVCENLLPLITSIAEKGDSFSVSVIIPEITKSKRRRTTKYFMLSYDGKNKQKPHIYKRSISQNDAYKYYYGKIFKKSNPDFVCLMTPEDINKEFYFSDSSQRGKYEQYIGIPICCDGNKMIGLLQIVADKDSIISSDQSTLEKIINDYFICYADFILFADKIEKGVALDIR